MKEQIVQYINDLEKKENVKVLLAVESGSRSCVFPSADSDYDVRLISIKTTEGEKDKHEISKYLIEYAMLEYDKVIDRLNTFRPNWAYPKNEQDSLDLPAIKYIKKNSVALTN